MTTYSVEAYHDVQRSKWAMYLVNTDNAEKAKDIVRNVEPNATRIDAEPLKPELQEAVLIPPNIPVHFSDHEMTWLRSG